ncbi:MAG: hypothetical protein Q9169_008212 [Polycauliona sp. 2 TL-2023]
MSPRKRKSAPLPAVGFPIIKLPSELQHLIFNAADMEDICNLRLTCKALAEIGVSYVLRQVELLFTRNSFDHLKAVLPNKGHHVKSFVYRVSTLSNFHTFDEYIGRVAEQLEYDWEADQAAPEPAPEASSRESRLYARQVARAVKPKIRYTTRQLRIGWEHHKILYNEQTLLRTNFHGENELTNFIFQMPGLNEITVNGYKDSANESQNFKNAYRQTLLLPDNDEGHADPCGVPQLLSIIQAINNAATKIKVFRVKRISWKLLRADSENRKTLERFLAKLRSFTATFTLDHLDWWSLAGSLATDQTDLEEHVYHGRHLWLLRAMPDLRELDIRFSYLEDHHFDMVQMFSGIHWCYLQTLCLNDVKGTDRNLLDFLEQHVATLKTLALARFSLTQGLWL